MYGTLEDDNVTFNGLVGMVQQGKVDIVVADLSPSEARATICDFAIPLWWSSYWSVIKKC